MLVKMNKLLAPEGEVAGGGVSQEPEAPTGETEPNPSSEADASERSATETEERSGQSARENHIPHQRAEEMARRRESRAYEKAKAEYRAEVDKLKNTIPAEIVNRMLAGLGAEPPKPQPKYVDEETFNRRMAQYGQAVRDQLITDQEVSTADAEIERARAKHADAFELDPDLEETIIDRWGADAQQRPISFWVAREVKRANDVFEKRAAKFNQDATGAGGKKPTTPMKPGPPRNSSKPKQDLSTKEGQDAAVDAIFDARGQ